MVGPVSFLPWFPLSDLSIVTNMARLCPSCGSNKIDADRSYDITFGYGDDNEPIQVFDGVEVHCRACGWTVIVCIEHLMMLALDSASTLR